MKIDEMNMVITGANGVLASYLLKYFSIFGVFALEFKLVLVCIPWLEFPGLA